MTAPPGSGPPVVKIDEIFPCRSLELLMRSHVIVGSGIVEHWPMVRHYVSELAEAADGTGGVPPPDLLSQE